MMNPPQSATHRSPLVRAALAFHAALKDCRAEAAFLLVDSKVTCFALVRPGLSVYHGHDGVASLAAYVHAAYGNYQLDIEEITEVSGAEVTVRAQVVPEPGYQPQPPPIVTRYTFRDGLIISIESEPANDQLRERRSSRFPLR